MSRKRSQTLSGLSLNQKIIIGLMSLSILATIIAAFISRAPTKTQTPIDTLDAPLTLQPSTAPHTPLIPSETPAITPPTAITPVLPSLTPSPTLSSSTEPAPFFLDEFNGIEIDLSSWTIVNAGLTIKDQALYANFLNQGSGFTGQFIEKKIKAPQFRRVEYMVKVINGTDNGILRMVTTCNDANSRIHIDISNTLGILGHYSTSTIPEAFLDWGRVIAVDQQYNILLFQDGDIVRVYLNGVEMKEPFPCKSMGGFLWLAAAASPGSFIEGNFDYIKLYAE